MTGFLGVDLGTGGVRCVVLDESGGVQAEASQALPRLNLRSEPGLSEQEPADWVQALDGAMTALSQALPSSVRIEALAVDSTSGTVLAADNAGEALSPALLHNDTRAQDQARRASETLGQAISPTFSLAKILWLQANGFAGARFVHATDFLNELLVGKRVPTDCTNALKSGLNLQLQVWPAELATLGVFLADVVSPGTPIGVLAPHWQSRWGLPAVPVCAGATDSNAGFYASGTSKPGDWSTTIGTVLAIKGVCAHEIQDPQGRFYSHRHPDGFWLPGGASNSGGEVLRHRFAGADLAELDRQLGARPREAEAATSQHLVYPLVRKGERMPFVAADAQGWHEGDPQDQVGYYRACLEGVAFLERWSFEELAKLGANVKGIVATTGGGCRSDVWCQIRADVLQRDVVVPAHAESAVGAAILAYAGARGTSVSHATQALVREAKRFRPQRSLETTYQRFRARMAR